MTLLASTRARRGGIIAVAAAVLAALTVAALAVTGPTRAAAAQQRPAQPLGSVLGSRFAAMALAAGQTTAGSAGSLIYQNGRYTALGSLPGLTTIHTDINNRGEIAGSYVTGGVTAHGFIRDAGGHYTTFDAAAAPGTMTEAAGINNQGTVVGAYGVTVPHGFVRSPAGTITTVNVPGSQDTLLYGVNDSGALVGSYVDAQGLEHGFMLENGTLTVIDPPGSPASPAARDTGATDINDQGQIVGFYADATGTYHGYLYDKGRFTRLDPPGAADVPNFATTVPWGINDRGQVVGQYVDAAAVLHGYLWQPGRGFTTIDPPQITSFDFGVPGAGTIASDINDRGQIILPLPGGLYKGRAVPISG